MNKEAIRKDLEEINLPQEVDRDLIVDRLFLLDKYTNHYQYEKTVKKYAELMQSGNDKLAAAALLHDIGKSGPLDISSDKQPLFIKAQDFAHDTVSRLFAIEGVKPAVDSDGNLIIPDKRITIDQFLDIAVEQKKLTLEEKGELLDGLKEVENPFTDEEYSASDTMGDFWDAHTLWSVQILKAAGISSEIVQAVAEHHKIDVVGENNLAIIIDTELETIERKLEGFESEKISLLGQMVFIADQYDALLSRSKLPRETALKIVKTKIRNTPMSTTEMEIVFKKFEKIATEYNDESVEQNELKARNHARQEMSETAYPDGGKIIKK